MLDKNQHLQNLIHNYVPVATLSTQDNAKLLQQLKSGFKRTINWNKFEPIDLSKHQALDADPKGIQQINFAANLFFIIEEATETIFDFSQELLKYCNFNFLFYNINKKWFNITF